MLQKNLKFFFTNVGPNLAENVPNSSNQFTSFLNQTHMIMEKTSYQ